MQPSSTSPPAIHSSHGRHAVVREPTQPHETTPDCRPPSLAERIPEARAVDKPVMPALSAGAHSLASTPPQLRECAGMPNLPADLLHLLIALLRPDNTIPSIRNVARFRATCKHLHRSIPQPIPESVMGAVEFNRPEVLQQLLLELQQSGKDVAQHLNCEKQQMIFTELNRGISLPLALAAFLGHVELSTALLAAGAKVDQSSSGGISALVFAAMCGHTAIVHALLQAGATVDLQSDSACPTALMGAAMNGHTATVQALLAWGASPDLAIDDDHGDDPPSDGMTALMMASEKGHTGAVEALLHAGAKVDQSNFRGRTALMLAAANGHATSLQALLQAGANCSLTCKRGGTALDYATAAQHEEVIKLLRAHPAAAYT